MGNVFKFILPVLAIALTTWGHWPKADEAILQNPFQEQKLILNLQSMVEQGTLSASAVDRSRATPGNLMLPAGSQLLALVNTSCAQAGSGRKHTQSVGDVRDAILPVQAYSLELLSETSVRQLSDELEQDPCIVGVTENAEVHISGEFTNDPGLAQQTAMAAIRADLGYDFLWGSSFKINQDVIIAIVDTGVAYTHPDLTNSMWRNAANQVGFDFINNDTDPMDDNDPGHGTHVAGLAAATGGNAVGISGVMGYRAKIMAVKCMDAEGSGTIAGIVNGL
ncbi:MAG: S8 family serine peptidase, partial [Bdellovibrionales bacterium]